MMDKMIERLVSINTNGSWENIWDEFSNCTLDEKKEILAKLLTLVSSTINKAVVTPNGASVMRRRLKPGVNFNRWYQEWLPPVKAENRGMDHVRDYFSVPTRVINLRLPDNDDEFLTIGFVYSPFDSVDELLNTRPKEIKESELKRREVNDELLAQSEVAFYYVASDDIFGI